MPNEVVYGFCQNKCKKEVLAKSSMYEFSRTTPLVSGNKHTWSLPDGWDPKKTYILSVMVNYDVDEGDVDGIYDGAALATTYVHKVDNELVVINKSNITFWGVKILAMQLSTDENS